MTLLTKRKAESDPVDFEDEMTNGNIHHEIHLGNLTNEDIPHPSSDSSSLLLTDPVQNHSVNMNHMDHAAMASELNSHNVRKDVEDHDDDDDVDVDDDHDLVVDDEDTKAAVEAVMGEMDVSDVGCSGAKKRAAVGGDANWNAMLFQLIFYKAVHGDLRPKSKDEEHKPLYDWMVGQRKEFKVYQETPEKSYLTPDQVKVLDFLQFPWNTRGDEHWIRNLEHLQQFRREHGHCMVPRTFLEVPNLCHWVTDQRRQLKNLKAGKPSTMTKERQRVLDEMGFVWQVRNRTTWDIRFAELVEYKEKKGTTVVPQHYAANRALGKWVAKQREQYRALKKGEHSFLTPDRLEQLNQIGFVWSMKGRVPREDDDDVDEAAAVAAAKAAVAAAVEAQNRHHQGEDEDDEDDDDDDENDHRVQVPAIKEDADEDVGVNMANIPGDVSLNQSHPDIGLEAKVEYDDADPLSAMV